MSWFAIKLLALFPHPQNAETLHYRRAMTRKMSDVFGPFYDRRKLTAMMVLGKHMEVLLIHAQKTLLIIQEKKRKWKAEINLS